MKTTIETVRSADGTPIAYERTGKGEAVVLVGWGLQRPVVGRRDHAVELYQLEAIRLPAPMVAGMRASDMWRRLTALAPSLPYDAALYDADYGPPTDRLARIEQPTLAVSGSKTFESLRAATHSVAEAIPHARYVELPGQDHGILHRPEALEAVMVDFLS